MHRPHASTPLPPIVDQAEWERARADLLVKEKAHTRAGDALAAERRRLPMVAIEREYVLTGHDGPLTLLDMFKGRRQLVLYHHMLRPQDPHPCDGCSSVADGVGRLEHIHARDVTFAMTADAPIEEIEAFRTRMGWSFPFYSAHGTDFTREMNINPYGPGSFGLSVLLRDGERIFRTYFTQGRGVEHLIFGSALLDIVPFGRQEAFEDSPPGWPQAPTYSQGALHDEYAPEQLSGALAPSSAGAAASGA